MDADFFFARAIVDRKNTEKRLANLNLFRAIGGGGEEKVIFVVEKQFGGRKTSVGRLRANKNSSNLDSQQRNATFLNGTHRASNHT